MALSKNLLLLAINYVPAYAVATHSASGYDTPNGYVCNLCHPYPPPSTRDVVVRFSKAENEQFGFPWERGVTCMEVWDTVLDFANPNVYDEESCNSMAAAYAPQCCHDVAQNPEGNPDGEEEHQINEQEVAELKIQETTVVSKTVTDPIDESIENTRSSSNSNDGKEKNDGNNVRRTTVTSHLRGRK